MKRALNRRELLVRGGLGLAGAAVGSIARPAASLAQTPKRGGTLTIRAWDPPHFDPYISISYKTQVLYQMPSSVYLAVWDSALKNYGPNLGYHYGGQLLQAWLDR